MLIVDLARYFPLPELEGQVAQAHQSEVDGKSDDREGRVDLVVFLRVEDQEEQDNGEDVLEVDCRVDQEVPDAERALISIRIYLVRVLRLVAYHLVEFPALEFHLLLVELVFNDVGSTLYASNLLLVALLLVVYLAHAGREALTVVR